MTRLRKMMLEELERRNYSEATTRCYIRTVEDFSRRFKRSPDCLGPEHIREYQAELFKKRKLSPGTVVSSATLTLGLLQCCASSRHNPVGPLPTVFASFVHPWDCAKADRDGAGLRENGESRWQGDLCDRRPNRAWRRR
jgi:Phage integrase, N-terminal SAM-like domain